MQDKMISHFKEMTGLLRDLQHAYQGGSKQEEKRGSIKKVAKEKKERKPMPAHLLYRKVFFPKLKEMVGDNKELINKLINEKWRGLSEEQKNLWKQKAIEKMEESIAKEQTKNETEGEKKKKASKEQKFDYIFEDVTATGPARKQSDADQNEQSKSSQEDSDPSQDDIDNDERIQNLFAQLSGKKEDGKPEEIEQKSQESQPDLVKNEPRSPSLLQIRKASEAENGKEQDRESPEPEKKKKKKKNKKNKDKKSEKSEKA